MIYFQFESLIGLLVTTIDIMNNKKKIIENQKSQTIYNVIGLLYKDKHIVNHKNFLHKIHTTECGISIKRNA